MCDCEVLNRHGSSSPESPLSAVAPALGKQHFVMPAADKAPRWSRVAGNEVIKQFNLFTQSGGEEGWDPRDCSPEYIKLKVKDNDELRPFLAGKLGGFHSNKDSAKILRGYERVSSEYFVKLAKAGVRRSTLTSSLLLLAVAESHISIATIFLTTEAYIADEGKGGKRKKESKVADEGTTSDEEDEDKDEAGEEQETGAKMPAKKTVKAPMPKTPPKPPTTPPTAKGDEDDVDGLADDVQANLNLNAWYKVDRSQEFAIVACVFPDPKTQTRYVYIRVELTGSIESSQVKARLIKDGDAAEITIKFQKGGELTNPEHCLVQFQDVHNFDAAHPL